MGFASAHAPEGVGQAFDEFIAQGRHGDMGWLAANAERRKDPRVLWPEARSIIMLGLSYAPDRDPLEALQDLSRGTISVYARGLDYHDVIKAQAQDAGRRRSSR